ncbi:MAG: hypothetical protein AB7G93_10200 [Bdellovibrionales bacterium]
MQQTILGPARWFRPFVVATAMAVGLGGCASGVKKAELPPDANPADLISRTESDIQQGYADQLDVLAPGPFADARERFEEAKEEYREGDDREDIMDNLGYARAHLDRARQQANERREPVKGILDARMAAMSAGARNYPELNDTFGEVDTDFRGDVEDFAEGDVDPEAWARLQRDYLQLELKATQANQLSDARNKIDRAIDNGAEERTPRVLAATRRAYLNAANVIAANTNNPKGFQDEVERANEMADLLHEVLDVTRTSPGQIDERAALDVVMKNREIADLNRQLLIQTAALERAQDATQLQPTMGEEPSAQKSLDEATATAKKQLTPDQAQVFQQGDRLLIRLKRIDVKEKDGKTTLTPESVTLLTKVTDVARTLGPEHVIVQAQKGTAQSGTEDQAQRAQAVADFMASKGVQSDRVQTQTGAATDRDLDVIIVPVIAADKGENQNQGGTPTSDQPDQPEQPADSM